MYSENEWYEIVDSNPFLDKNREHIKQLYCTLLSNTPSEQNSSTLNKIDFAPDAYIIKGNVIYFKYPDGKTRAMRDVFLEELESL